MKAFRIPAGAQWARPFWHRVTAGFWGVTLRRTIRATFVFHPPPCAPTHIKLVGLARLALSARPAHRDSRRLLALFRGDHVVLRWYVYAGGERVSAGDFAIVPYGKPVTVEVTRAWRGPSLICFAHANNGPSSPSAPCTITFSARRQ